MTSVRDNTVFNLYKFNNVSCIVLKKNRLNVLSIMFLNFTLIYSQRIGLQPYRAGVLLCCENFSSLVMCKCQS